MQFVLAVAFLRISMNAGTCRRNSTGSRGGVFDDSKLYLMCSVHGALYAPESGRCLGGRCHGKGLVALPIDEMNGLVYLKKEVAHG